MTYEEIGNAMKKACEDASFSKKLDEAASEEQYVQLLKDYNVIEDSDDVAKFKQVMKMTSDELDESTLAIVSGGKVSDFFNIPKWVNDAASELWKGLTYCYNKGRQFQKWLNKF